LRLGYRSCLMSGNGDESGVDGSLVRAFNGAGTRWIGTMLRLDTADHTMPRGRGRGRGRGGVDGSPVHAFNSTGTCRVGGSAADAPIATGSAVVPDDLTASHHRVGGVAASPTPGTMLHVDTAMPGGPGGVDGSPVHAFNSAANPTPGAMRVR